MVFLDSPLLQIVPIIVLFSSTFYITVKFKPYDKKLMNVMTIVNEGSYILIMMFYFGLMLAGPDMEAKFRYQYFGLPLCFLVAITILINVIICIVSVC